ncbi:hypothetical protein SAMN05660485_00291 [Blastococcus fimeti]|nr:hypothetical protein SAMN05660485_00291 [Blastococcus fimeti]
MISTTWTDTPAGISGPGSIGMSRSACSSAVGGTGVLMAPIAAPLQGSGLPVAVRLRPIDERGVTVESYLVQALAIAGPAPLGATDNFDTTLGIHSPGRPQS